MAVDRYLDDALPVPKASSRKQKGVFDIRIEKKLPTSNTA
jgi:hypothetical protein